jgi:hypothetical protein
MARRPPPPAECAQCGAAIPPRALACPECGADERTGWRETSLYDGLDLPETAYDEPAAPADRPRRALPWYWFAVAFLLVALFVLAGLGLR